MKPNANSAVDDLARFVQVIGRDAALREQFQALANMSQTQRANEIHILAERMAAKQGDPEVLRIFRLFAHPAIFEATMRALQECGYISK